MKRPEKFNYFIKKQACSGRTIVFRLLLLSVLAFSLLWPGDLFWGRPGSWQLVFWNYPEQIETIRTALQANQYHELAVSGVRGSTPVVYHPLHVWIYQGLLCLTPDLATIVLIKQVITLSLCLFGLYYLSRALAFSFYPAMLLVLFSPFLYAYSRQLSDDPWLIPLSLLAYCCYAWFFRKKGWLPVVAGMLVSLLMFFVHPRGLIPGLGFLCTLVLFEHRWIRKHVGGMALLMIAALIAVWPTLANLYYQLHVPAGATPSAMGMMTPHLPAPAVSRLNMLFPLISGGMFFSYDFMALLSNATLGTGRFGPAVTRLLTFISMAGYVLVVCGMVLTIVRLIGKKRNRQACDLEDRLGTMSLVMIALYLVQVIVFLRLKKFYPPDYHIGLWFAYFYFIWRAAIRLFWKGRRRAVIHGYVAVMGLLWVYMILSLHVAGDYSLADGIRLAKRIASHSPQSDVVLLADFTGEVADELDTLADNTGRSPIGFYYRPYFRETKMFIDKMRRQHSNLLGYSLNPLVLHYRQQEGGRNSAPRTMIIKWRPDKGGRRLVLIDDPEAVGQELKQRGIRGPCLSPGDQAD